MVSLPLVNCCLESIRQKKGPSDRRGLWYEHAGGGFRRRARQESNYRRYAKPASSTLPRSCHCSAPVAGTRVSIAGRAPDWLLWTVAADAKEVPRARTVVSAIIVF